ncbi:ankyrin repeat domain-containing protein 26-like [Microtus oregoni]|uniref:ankyrin repeat domain-containing protein 26-like n=1 Tax=Microtus oregoni TaxID=111838 RepID=UPI001BB168DA|nr:ankyrin repeat domain-containing protein 26-like [Microtus oregoni]
MQEDMEYDALTIRAPQPSRWYTRLWPACLGHGCLSRRQQRFPLYLIGYDPVGRLQRAASVGDVKLVERLINASEHHVNECDRRGRSPLHYASAHNHPNVVTLLSSNNSTDINMKDDEGCTPLIKAAQRDNVECISILLRHGADPHIVDANGDAALHHAICRGNIPVVSKLLEYNVDIKAKTEYGLTPYKLALFENQLKMAEFLIENGAVAPSELTPNSGGAAAVESEQSMKTCANSNKEENFSTDIKPSCSAVRPARQLKSLLKKSFLIKRGSRRLKDEVSLSEGTMTREPEQRKKKCVTFNKEVHYNTNKKAFCSGI